MTTPYSFGLQYQETPRNMPTFFRFLVIFLVLFLWPTEGPAQLNRARSTVDSIASHARGTVGVAVIDLRNGDTLTVNAGARFPMQSVYKFPLAIAVLDQVDRGMLSLGEVIHVAEDELIPNTWSPLRRIYSSGDVDLPLDTLLRYTVSYSDNNGCDVLFRLVGGPAVVNDYVRSLGIRDIAIVSTEHEMHKDAELQYKNWSSPLAMATLLRLSYSGDILSEGSRTYLFRLLSGSNTTPHRLKGQLPPGAHVAHKSGSSGTDEFGVAAATNDVGFLTFPDGRTLAIAVFVTDSDAPNPERDAVIASITRAVWECFQP